MYIQITETTFAKLLLITGLLAFVIVSIGWAINIVRKGGTIKFKWPYERLDLLEEIGLSRKNK